MSKKMTIYQQRAGQILIPHIGNLYTEAQWKASKYWFAVVYGEDTLAALVLSHVDKPNGSLGELLRDWLGGIGYSAIMRERLDLFKTAEIAAAQSVGRVVDTELLARAVAEKSALYQLVSDLQAEPKSKVLNLRLQKWADTVMVDQAVTHMHELSEKTKVGNQTTDETKLLLRLYWAHRGTERSPLYAKRGADILSVLKGEVPPHLKAFAAKAERIIEETGASGTTIDQLIYTLKDQRARDEINKYMWKVVTDHPEFDPQYLPKVTEIV
ncbi:MAG: hypothetical protein KF726_27000 [Anaerolineae bacterium]|nr:hypothetical protein [Anaerolineae bacterium]